MSLWEAIKDFFGNYANYQARRKDGAESTEAALDELGEEICVNCGSGHLKKNGVETKTPNPYQRYRCLDCGTALRGRLRTGGGSENTYIEEI